MSSLLFCVSSLVENFPQGLEDCRNPALALEELLRQRAAELQGKEESQVNKTFYHSLKWCMDANWSFYSALQKYSTLSHFVAKLPQTSMYFIGSYVIKPKQSKKKKGGLSFDISLIYSDITK